MIVDVIVAILVVINILVILRKRMRDKEMPENDLINGHETPIDNSVAADIQHEVTHVKPIFGAIWTKRSSIYLNILFNTANLYILSVTL